MPAAKPCKDHRGKEYSSIREMCDYYDLDDRKFQNRIKAGYSLEAALTGEGIERKIKPCMDHTGRKYESERKMCDAYEIGYGTFRDRIRSGWILEDALTIPPIEQIHETEHIGIKKQMNNGLDATIIEYSSKDRIKIRFEDGEEVECALGNFYKGSVAHPHLSTRRKSDYGCVRVEGYNKFYGLYKVECQECKKKYVECDKYRYILRAKELFLRNRQS